MIETISDPKNPNQNQQAPPQIYLPSCPPCNPPPCNPPPCNPPPGNPPPYSPEDGHSDFDNAFEDKAIRRGFIRKVYGILCIQLSISLGSVLLFTMSKEAQNFAFNSFWFFIVAFGMSICTLCPMMCSQSLRRQTPHNYIFLILFTIAFAILIGYVAAATADRGLGRSRPETGESLVMLAVVLTAGIVLGLTLFAFQTKWDLTAYNGTMFVILLCFTLSGFVVLFFRHISIARIIWPCVAASLFSIYIVIDTQLIVGGEHRKYQISSEEYIFASLLLYVDIIYLFIYILHMLNR